MKKNSKAYLVPTRMGFEPTRALHIGLAVQRLNHSATSSCVWIGNKMIFIIDVNECLYIILFVEKCGFD